MRFSGKVALVTGSGRGIGRAIALALAKEGSNVAVNAAHLSSAEETAEDIRKIGRKTIAIEADVSDEEEVRDMISKVINELGGIHILVNNAGVNLEIEPVLEQSLDKFDRMMSINVRGTYLCSKYAGEWMVTNKIGKVINIASTAGMTGLEMRTGYGATKAAIINMTQSLANEWGKYNINVNSVSPGPTMTELFKSLVKQGRIDLAVYKRQTPLGKIAKPEDIANAVIFLASEEASHITGVNLPVEGGWMTRGLL